jgi:hypothetical protein
MYETELTFNSKKYKIKVKTIFGVDDGKEHYDLEVSTNRKMSGNEFLSLRKYLEEEGYIEQARVYNEELYK